MRRRSLAGLLWVVAAAAGCVRTPPPEPDWTPVPPPAPEAVDAVVLLVGDAGEANPGRSPVLAHLAREVERWAEALASEGAVSVVYLGDNVYPSGIHDRDHPSFVEDSTHLRSQVDVLAGPAARRWGARGWFLAGNHDWGNEQGYEGLLRLQNQEALLAAFAEAGIARVELVPDAGLAGPTVVDQGSSVRLVFLDTHWWLQARHHIRRDTVFLDVDEILSGAGERALLFASHHPFASGGAHGGPMPFWRGLGTLWLLRKTGALVQDLNATIYQQLLNGLETLFEEIRQPLIYAGGHDHSLQVIEDVAPNKPQWSLVSGSASKLTDVGAAPGMRYGADRPGYMALVYRKDGAVELFVHASEDRYQHCGDEDGEDVATCMAEGVESFETAFAAQLRAPHRAATTPSDSVPGGR